jgi:hypothetical protein
MEPAGEAGQVSAIWIDGDLLFEVRGWNRSEQVAEIVQAAHDR